MENQNYENAIKLITSREKFHICLGLDRVSQALELLGNPQDRLNIIHVAGTNGKGSVCAILSAILSCAGFKTGLYTSPHIIEYTERIKINRKNISKSDFADLITEISLLAKVNGIYLTEFELLTCAAYKYFADKETDICVIETGLGGRLDATSAINKNILSIITSISLDHTDRLGDTVEKIAFEKAGIIKPDCPVITSMGYEAIRDRADELNSMLVFVSPYVPQDFIDSLALKGLHQVENLALVITAINYLFKNIDEETIKAGLSKVKNPCRFEYIKEKNLIIDASHNPNGILALRNNLDYYFPNQARRFVFGCLKTKDYSQMMKILFQNGDEVYLNGFNYPNACSYEILKENCPVEAEQYTEKVKLTPDKLNIICGSFYMIGKMKF